MTRKRTRTKPCQPSSGQPWGCLLGKPSQLLWAVSKGGVWRCPWKSPPGRFLCPAAAPLLPAVSRFQAESRGIADSIGEGGREDWGGVWKAWDGVGIAGWGGVSEQGERKQSPFHEGLAGMAGLGIGIGIGNGIGNADGSCFPSTAQPSSPQPRSQ